MDGPARKRVGLALAMKFARRRISSSSILTDGSGKPGSTGTSDRSAEGAVDVDGVREMVSESEESFVACTARDDGAVRGAEGIGLPAWGSSS